MCSKDKFITTLRITQLEIRCFYHNTKNYFEIIENIVKDNISYNQNIYECIINRYNINTTKINKHLKISTY